MDAKSTRFERAGAAAAPPVEISSLTLSLWGCQPNLSELVGLEAEVWAFELMARSAFLQRQEEDGALWLMLTRDHALAVAFAKEYEAMTDSLLDVMKVPILSAFQYAHEVGSEGALLLDASGKKKHYLLTATEVPRREERAV